MSDDHTDSEHKRIQRLAARSMADQGHAVTCQGETYAGAPDITHADEWLSAACEQLATLAHEHNDQRLLDLRATLLDIIARGTVLPRELAASLALAAVER